MIIFNFFSFADGLRGDFVKLSVTFLRFRLSTSYPPLRPRK